MLFSITLTTGSDHAVEISFQDSIVHDSIFFAYSDPSSLMIQSFVFFRWLKAEVWQKFVTKHPSQMRRKSLSVFEFGPWSYGAYFSFALSLTTDLSIKVGMAKFWESHKSFTDRGTNFLKGVEDFYEYIYQASVQISLGSRE